MKNIHAKATAVLLAAAIGGTLACSGDSGCGDPYANSGSNSSLTSPFTLRCGAGTALDQTTNQCVRVSSGTR